jgi:hypothetical protein
LQFSKVDGYIPHTRINGEKRRETVHTCQFRLTFKT